MPIIRQESLFDLQELYSLEPSHRFDEVFSAIDSDPILYVVSKKAYKGAPVRLNYRAMIHALLIRILERIPTIKDLVRRLQYDVKFHMDCGFHVSDAVPSEASFSRMVTKIQDSNVLETVQTTLLVQAFTEGFMTDDTVAIDATHIEARDAAPAKLEKERKQRKKRGRKPKAEQEAWRQEQAQKAAALPLYEKPIEDQLDVPFTTLQQDIPLDPAWGIKKSSKGKNVFWFGFKSHLAVATTSQYILQSLFSSGNLNDGKAAIGLIKGIKVHLPFLKIRHYTMDAGYDVPAIYEQVHRVGSQSTIAYNPRNEPEWIGFDAHFAPTCVREHSYQYDSYDSRYQTVKYTRPRECSTCPLNQDTLCQKVYKVKITNDLRKYSAPARGSKAWKTIYKRRTAVERVIAYLKEFFQMNNIRYRTGKRAKVHAHFAQLIYNGAKLACDRLTARLIQQTA